MPIFGLAHLNPKTKIAALTILSTCMGETVGLEAVFEWEMTPMEAEVFNLAVAYEQLFRKLFTGSQDGQSFKRNSIPRRGDPRKSYLFRHCWTMRRETRGLLESFEYRNYIYANLLIIKLNKGHVQPNCICGDKAWIRYKVWKRKYDEKMAEISVIAPPPSVSNTNPKIVAEIDRTKKFLFEKCDGEPTYDKVKSFIDCGFARLWIATGKLSPYYLALSPYIQRSGQLNPLFGFCSASQGVIQEKLTDEVREYFKHEFRHEVASVG